MTPQMFVKIRIGCSYELNKIKEKIATQTDVKVSFLDHRLSRTRLGSNTHNNKFPILFLAVNSKKQNLTCIVMPSLGGGLVNMVSSTEPLCRAPLPLGPALDPWLFCPLFPGESEPPETAPDVEPPPKNI